jgi:AraC-like DNA-binding protein
LKAALAGIQKKIEVQASHIGGAEGRTEMFKSAAQLLLLLDRPEEADDYFTAYMKQASRKSKDDYNATSCLLTGIQNLYHNHLRLAASCLQRALESKGTSLQTQIESCAALATLFFKLGMRRPANMSVDHALRLAEQDGHEAPCGVLEVLRVEFLALNFLRQHHRLNDLAFWPRREEIAGELVPIETVLRDIEACKKKVEKYDLLQERLDFLSLLIRLAYRQTSSIKTALEHIEKVTHAGLISYAQAARIELALAAAAAGNVTWVQTILQPLTAPRIRVTSLNDNLEFEYCQAKLAEMQHREDGYISHYRQYTQAAIVQIRRVCAYITIPHVIRTTTNQIPKDNVATRLPGKYRRAYRFLIENLDNPRLSVKMVADEIGVTERSLQLTFRAHLAQSPSEVIRRCRMENIRTDLEAGATHTGSTLLDVATRWGIGSRSSLGHSYQQEFNETPRQTIEDFQTRL